MKEKTYEAIFYWTENGKTDNVFSKDFHAYNMAEAKGPF